MHVPSLLERVRIQGQTDLFLVTRVDADQQVADLLPIRYGLRSLEKIPFLSLEAVAGHVAPRLRPPEFKEMA